MTPRARRGIAVGAALGVLAVGLAIFAMTRPAGANATESSHAACEDIASALQARSVGTEATLRRASDEAEDAAEKDSRYNALAGAASRLTGPPPAPHVGVVAVPSDIAALQSMCPGGVLPPSDAVVVRAPYLTDVTTNAALVNFATDRPFGVATVTYGDASGECHLTKHSSTSHSDPISFAGKTDYLVSLPLTALSPGTRYCYQLGGDVFDLSTFETPPVFSTAPAPTDPRAFSFAVIGDFGDDTSAEANVLRQMSSSPASFIMTVGDNAYVDGTQTNYGDLSGGNVFGANEWPQVGESRPTYAAQGNHGFSSYQAGLANWPEPSVVQASGGRSQSDVYCCIKPLKEPHTYPSIWYAFDWGGARFYVLDGAWADGAGHYTGDQLAHFNGTVPGCEPCGVELNWLRADLAAHASTPLKFAFFHFPLYADASDHESDVYLDGPNGLEGVLAHAGVDVVFTGHAHLYERNLPQIPGSPMVSYITGGGGADTPSDALAEVEGCSSYDAYAIGANRTSCHAPKPKDNTDVYHYVLVTVQGRQVTVAPTNEHGKTFDVQTYSF